MTIRSAYDELALDVTDIERTLGGTTHDEQDFGPITPGAPVTGHVDPGNDLDYYTLNVVAGQTYVVSMNGTGPNAMPDPQIFVYDQGGVARFADDEGGTRSNALLTFTAAYTGVYYIEAGPWFDDTHDGIPGDYTLAVAQRGADVSNTAAGAVAVAVDSSTLGFIDQTGTTTATAFNDVDYYKVQLTAGQYYEFQVSAGWDYFPGAEADLRLHIQSEADLSTGGFSAFSGDISSDDQNAAVSFVAPTDGTYYIRISHDVASARATGAAPQSGYELSVRTFDLSGMNPLDAINWGGNDNVVPGAADGEILVYFAKAGETFDGETSLGWTAYEQQQAMLAFHQYETFLPVHYTVTNDASLADFKLVVKTTTEGDTPGVLGYFNPPGETNAGVGVFWRDGFGWDSDGPSVGTSFNGGLEQGGYAFYTLIHEFGHGMGLAHPHDTGGGSTVMAGVFGAFDSYGAYDLNQGVYTVMSYNPGWPLDPANDPYGVPWYIEGGVPYLEIDEAWNGGPSALDIALLQQKYGQNVTTNLGNTTYVLPAENAGDGYFTAIWDAGGAHDAIVHNGTQGALIDLTAATLDYSATGAGVVSHADGVNGGFTIANGVVIEDARGGSGNDVIIGNTAANNLIGGGGSDVIFSGNGFDVISLGSGNDTFMVEAGTKTTSKVGSISWDIITDFNGNGDLIDLSGLDDSFQFRGTSANKYDGDVTYKTYTSINGAENALGFDIDGHYGASGVSGPVTVVYVNTDGGGADIGLILLNTSSVDAGDFIFA